MEQHARNFRDGGNKRLSSTLFWEQWVIKGTDVRYQDPYFTLNVDKPGLINFGREYVKDEDKTGYKTGTRLLENYAHFALLEKNCNWFRQAKIKWDAEIDSKLLSRATDVYRSIMANEDAKPSERLAAAKAIESQVKAGKPKGPARGRPSKEEIEGELKRDAAAAKELLDDAARIQLVRG